MGDRCCGFVHLVRDRVGRGCGDSSLPTAYSPRMWLMATVICSSKTNFRPCRPAARNSWGCWSRVGSGNVGKFRL